MFAFKVSHNKRYRIIGCSCSSRYILKFVMLTSSVPANCIKRFKFHRSQRWTITLDLLGLQTVGTPNTVLHVWIIHTFSTQAPPLILKVHTAPAWHQKFSSWSHYLFDSLHSALVLQLSTPSMLSPKSRLPGTFVHVKHIRSNYNQNVSALTCDMLLKPIPVDSHLKWNITNSIHVNLGSFHVHFFWALQKYRAYSYAVPKMHKKRIF